jgi:hypothetical protein
MYEAAGTFSLLDDPLRYRALGRIETIFSHKFNPTFKIATYTIEIHWF